MFCLIINAVVGLLMTFLNPPCVTLDYMYMKLLPRVNFHSIYMIRIMKERNVD
jgi:hypothetical protein